jgi:Tfp pilus assembly protein PilF
MRKISALLFTVLLAWVVIACDEKKDPNQTIQDVPEQTAYSETIELKALNDAVLSDPDNPELYFRRGNYFLDQKEGEQAYKDAVRAIYLDSTQGRFWLLKSKALYTLPNVKLAMEAAKKAEALKLETPDLLVQIGEMHFVLKEYAMAIKYMDRAIKIAKYEPKAYFYKGLIFSELKDSAKAVSSLQTAIELSPEFVDAYNKLAVLYFDQKKYDMAKQYLESGLRFRPKDAFLHYNMGLYFDYTQKPDSAVTWLKRAIFFEPSLYSAHFKLGKYEFDARRYSNSIDHFEAAKSYAPKQADVLFFLGSAYAYTGKRDEARKNFDAVIANKMGYEDRASEQLKKLKETALAGDTAKAK